jgi:type IX secretion system PorP/SprF family membrane protein
MKRRKYLFLILFILLLHFYNVNGQDPSFSQFYFNKLYFNPAFCGLSGGFEASLTDRILWPNIPSKFNTEKFSADLDISSIRGLGGAGIIAVSDVEGAGSLRTTQVGLPVSVRIKLNKSWLLQGGFIISIIQKSINWNKFVFSDQFDNVDGIVRPSSFSIPNESKMVFPDIGSGLVFEYQKASPIKTNKSKFSLRAGWAVDHITQPDFSFTGGGESKLPINITCHADAIIPFGFDNTFVIAPAVVWQKQAKMQTYFFGTNILWKSPFLGIWYRRYGNSDAIAFTAGIKLGSSFHGYISYTYDFTISGLMRATGGSHEINLDYIIDESFLSALGLKKDNRKVITKTIECPTF